MSQTDRREQTRQKIREVKQRAGTAEAVAQHYGLKVNPRTHRAICPFHEHGQSPDENLSFYGSGFRCFVCGAAGSSVDFVMNYFGLASPAEAARKIDADFGFGIFTGPQHRTTLARSMQEDFSKQQKEESKVEWAKQEFAGYEAEALFCAWRIYSSLYFEAHYLTSSRGEDIFAAHFRGETTDKEYAQQQEEVKRAFDKLKEIPSPDDITDEQLWRFGVEFEIIGGTTEGYEALMNDKELPPMYRFLKFGVNLGRVKGGTRALNIMYQIVEVVEVEAE